MEANTAPESDEAMNPNEQRTMNTNGHPNGQDDTTSARIQTFRFPGSTIGTVCQTGTQLGDRHAGVTVELHFRDKHDNRPQCAEVYGGEHYAEIGLEWDEDALTGCDGVFELPMEVVACLECLGFTVEECEPDAPRPTPLVTCGCGSDFEPNYGEFARCPSCLAGQHEEAEHATGLQ